MLKANHEIGEKESTLVTKGALEFVESLAVEFSSKLENLLKDRVKHQIKARANGGPDFLEETKSIREGSWRVAPPPNYLEDRRVEITAPADPKMVVNALNSDAKVYMACFEDALSPTWDNLIAGQNAIKCAVRRSFEFIDSNSKKTYTLNPDYTCNLMVRPRGLHMKAKHMLLDGVPIPGALMEFGFFVYHNAQTLLDQGLNPCLYLPKIEHYREAKWWNDVCLFAEKKLGLKENSIKTTVLIETFPAVFEMDEILYSLKERILGLNCGRWDYIFSYIKTMSSNEDYVLPDRSKINMEVPFMKAYSRLLIDTCHKRGAHAMGGMSAFIPVSGNDELNKRAFKEVSKDKKLEATNGHDGTWVAHPALIEVAQKEFDQVMPNANQKGVMSQETITRDELLEPPKGEVTLAGIDNNIQVILRYVSAWYGGRGAVPIFNLMEDAATAEIARVQIWQWINCDGAKLDGVTKITKELVESRLSKIHLEIKDEWGDAPVSKYLDLATNLFKRLVFATDLADFLTLPAYDELPSDD